MAADPLFVESHWTVARALRFMDRHGFDQAPVRHNGTTAALFDRRDVDGLRRRIRVGQEGSRPITPNLLIDQYSPVAYAISRLEDLPYCLVRDEDEHVVGIVHTSDLNRPPVRLYLYLLFSAFEAGLVDLIPRHVSDSEWQQYFNQKTLADLKQRHSKARRETLDLSLLESAFFSQLLIIVICNSRLAHLLLADTIKLDEFRELNALRNQVMHSTGELITRQTQVAALSTRTRLLRVVLRRLLQALLD